MSYSVYKVVHLIGIFMVLISLGGITLHVLNGGTKDFVGRKLAGATHGIGLLISLVGGFGLLARIGTGMQPWVFAKLGIWLIFGGMTALIYRKPALAKPIWGGIILLGGLAVFLVQYKPF